MSFRTEKVYNTLRLLEKTPKTRDKEEIIRNGGNDLLRVFQYALDPLKVYNLKKLPPQRTYTRVTDFGPIFKFLDKLASQPGTSKQEAQHLVDLFDCEETREVVFRIIKKDLKCGVNVKTINKAMGEEIIKDHSPMLCYYSVRCVTPPGGKKHRVSDDLKSFINSDWDNYIASVKEDGVRCWAQCHKDNPVSYISRNGLNYRNFSVFDDEIEEVARNIAKLFLQKTGKKISYKKIVIDGEVVSVSDNFQQQMTEVQRIYKADPSIFRFKVFDFTLDGVKNTIQQQDRLLILKKAIPDNENKKVMYLDHYSFNSEDDFLKFFRKVVKSGKEGVVLKHKHGLYENKRSQCWCKVKEFFSADLPVIGTKVATTGKYKGLLKCLVVDFNGVSVDIGTGYSDANRKKFLKKPPKLIEVEYKSITKDGSLFHASYQRVREDKTEVSYK